MTDLPDGWERVETDRDYTKLVRRDAVEVPKRSRESWQRDAVIAISGDRVGVVTGPSARRTYETNDAEAVALALATTVEAWIADGGDPYGGSELNDQLDEAAKDAAVATGRVEA